ncbi:FAD/NAD(P)-binding domain-containing protein [Aaosphaeria arxii CBS 175.79]|uniref:FAD/NAD(P)-binding domain-containing protein n=1 Tax=Aaosphaeria arxii CBS 175.79 TaxID=1450172 RepID=A0A6A5Y5E1_9PLEO|nr:FAD/NAD(P)-binding domain-containing protein [Aaosphaeria arxii CBS 175.79]KAF2020489.1 FAD/NAD(P)-binding domain-containing protein [Aaosphaeria arxii CBS 175.79]
MSLDTDVLIIGAGLSGIGTAVQLIRRFGTYNFEIIEKSNDIGGTWALNTYPGCGCDVPSHFYSFSFALNPDWSQVYPMQPELHAYFRSVAEKYKILPRVQYQAAVISAAWNEGSSTWTVEVQDTKTKAIRHKRCKILISAVGALSVPRDCDIPGAAEFNGKLFHSAQWDTSFDWVSKDVVIIGNGCSATQIVPAISQGTGAVHKVTQFSRQAHWLAKRVNSEYSRSFKWAMRWVPGVMRLYRAWIYFNKELGFQGFNIKSGEKIRAKWAEDASAYIRQTAPERYRDALIPKTVIGCKRRVNDTGYLESLHQPNVELVYDDPVEKISKNGLSTTSGRFVHADAIVLATGFQTHRFLFPMKITGENGITLQQHWDQVSDGTSSAYFGTCIAGFPNFFTLMGPNTITGHLSVIYTVECQINFILRIIKPILNAVQRPRISSGGAQSVRVKPEAELRDNSWIQEKCKALVWSTGCTSWFIDPHTGRNTQMYPQWMFLFWLRSFWIPWEDFVYSPSSSKPKPVGSLSTVSLWIFLHIVKNV